MSESHKEDGSVGCGVILGALLTFGLLCFIYSVFLAPNTDDYHAFGMESFRAGVPAQANPYVIHPARAAWLKGWIEAKRANEPSK